MSVYFCFSLGSSTAHQSASILVAPRLSSRGCSCRTSERCRLQNSRKAFMGRRARCSEEYSSLSSSIPPHSTACAPLSAHNTGSSGEKLGKRELEILVNFNSSSAQIYTKIKTYSHIFAAIFHHSTILKLNNMDEIWTIGNIFVYKIIDQNARH